MAENEYYKFNSGEIGSVADSYKNLGGFQGTGMDYNTWLKSQNINNTNGTLSTGTSGLGNIFGDQGFGFNQGTLQGLGTIGNLASGLGGIYLGGKQLDLAKEKFAFDKDMMNKQYNMAKDAYDKQVARAASIGSQMREGKVQ